MAHGFLKSWLHKRAVVYSAGMRRNPKGNYPMAVEVMEEVKIDISDHWSRSVEDFSNIHFDAVIILGEDVMDLYKHINALSQNEFYYDITDPGVLCTEKDTEKECIQKVRTDVEAACRTFLRDAQLKDII